MEAEEIDAIAREIFGVLGTGRQVAPYSRAYPGFSLSDAYRVTPRVRAMREARGEASSGRKIGFTNRTIWAEYGVYAPMWGHVYGTTVHDIASLPGAFSLTGFAEPRIEPEIVFGLACAPEAAMDEASLLGCIGWVAHGFEIVQSIYPNWEFTAADTAAAGGLHGALLIGPRLEATAANRAELLTSLATFEIDLACNDSHADHGMAKNVLDGPLSALRHLVGLLEDDADNPQLAAGEIVTTGTLTRAFPIAPGETWSTKISGMPLAGLSVSFCS